MKRGRPLGSRKREPKRKITVQGLRLQRHPKGFIDQYGRVLQEYVNEKGEPDLRPIGVDFLRPRVK